ncbi:laminin subunit gamma-1 isoform X2 [Ixodes scapularis]
MAARSLNPSGYGLEHPKRRRGEAQAGLRGVVWTDCLQVALLLASPITVIGKVIYDANYKSFDLRPMSDFDIKPYMFEPCGCSMAGSVDSPPSCDAATGVCRCKANVEGRQCDRCRPGFFNLQRDNEFGCTPCFCFGHSAICQSAPGYSKHTIYSTFTRDKEHWKAVDSRGARVPTRHEYAAHHLAVAAPGENQVYFVAPERFLGDQRGSYNQNLTFTLRIGEEGARSSLEDVVLESPSQSVSQHIFGQGNPLPSIRNQDYRFRLHQDSRYGWSPTLSAHEFMALLANLTAIKIRATYLPRGTGFIDNIELHTAQRSQYGSEAASWIEMCTCPDGYVGQFCESCAPGFRHDPPGGGRFSRCVPCNCNGHALICEPDTGHCICQHNTAGEFCERCAPRFYGNALVGSPEDCQPCPCPDQGACAVLPDESVVCLECPQGYSGRRCDLCFDGHFGDPQGRYGAERPCQKCDCNDNVDPNAVANCNTTTGECLKCIYKTAGFHCEKCLPGHYGDALAVPKGDCKPCSCSGLGSTSDQCDPVSGQCPCRPNVAGRECGQCREGTWNLEGGQGCEQCGCHLVGSVNRTCDQRTGQCHCRPGVGGKRCDQCLPYHYGFSPDGCLPCDCDSLGSVSLQCAPDGQCECRPNVEGRRCERCKENKYNREAGCVDCPTCYNLVQDAVNQHRDKVADLARLLDNIEKNPQIVKSVDFEKKLEEVMVIVNDLWKDAKQASGTDKSLADRLEELVRRMHRVQETASKVGQETWLAEEALWAAQSNLSQAEASVERMGTTLAQAHRFLEDEGQHALRRALERSHRFGQQSEMMSQIARDARQLADSHENDAQEIVNLAVDALNTTKEAHRIAEGAISTQHQTESEIFTLKKRMKDIMDLMLRTKKMAEEAKAEVVKAYEDALRVYSDTTSVQMPDIDTDDLLHQAQEIIEEAQRIYKEADDLMEKHKNIFDKVKPQKDEAEDLLAEAQRQQQVTDELLADTDAAYAKAKEAVQSGEKILEEAQNTLKTLKEFDENVKNSKEKARAALERVPEIRALIEEAENKTADARDALKDAEEDANAASDIATQAERIAEQASKQAAFRGGRELCLKISEGTGFIDNIELHTAQRSQYGSEAASWIEMCTCPDGYVGQFCESCAPGFRHDPPGGGRFSRCVPCNCNGHALICEPDTGHCICQHNTAGEFCERCAPRFYGNALVGSPEDCQPCPCPDQGACAVLPDESVVCLECPQGYSGRRCDLCFDGHFGDPQGRYGAERPCQKCDCNDNVDPNAVANCNTTTGECLKCIYKTAGFHCEKCLPGHYGDALAVPKGDCKPCSCSGLGSTSDQCDPVSGQCPCRPNVAGRECGQCREGTWNLEGGQGCEQCGCHLVGSVNRTCDQRTGQCHCRPGVGGKRCDQCLPYHYGFSPDGCLPCDCDSLGSVSLQCAPDGQCECRPNVEGRRCERCKENKYNREAGCVDCPTCYNLVQDAVNQHRDKVADLARLLDNIEKNPQIVKSVDFEKKLEEVMVIVNDLWKDAKQASGTDKSLADRLEELVRRMHRVQETASKVGQETWLAEEALWAAQSNLSQAEASVERMGTTLAQAHRFLEDEGQHALRRALERSHRFGQQSEMMSQIARDARQLADSHENDAQEIVNLAVDALNTTKEAHRIAEGAISTQHQTESEIFTLKKRMKDIMDLMLRTKKMAEEAKAEVVKAYEDALRVYSDTTSVQMPDIDTDDLLHQAQEIIEEAQRIYKEADDLMEKHKNIFDKVKPQKDEAEDLLAEAQRQQQVTDELLADTDAAYAKAKEAVQSGEKILEEAQNTLKTLKEFDENVKNSKEKARAALERVPEIRALIEEAENKTADARDALKDAEEDANAASDIATQAERIAEQASKDAIHVRNDADLARSTADKLRNEADALADSVQATDERMRGYQGQAKEDEALAKEALEKANEARTGAKQASDKVRDALATVNDILRALANVDEVDPGRLDELERRLAEAERELERARLAERLAELQKAREQQVLWMRDYEDEINQLKKDVANVRLISEALPDKCYRRIRLEP